MVSCFRTCSLCRRRAVVEKARVAILDAMASAGSSGNGEGGFGWSRVVAEVVVAVDWVGFV